MSGATRMLSALALAAAVAAVPIAGPATAAPAAAGSPPAAGKPHSGVPEPKTKFDPIPYGKDRKRQMANYSKRHYGKRTWRLSDPDVIVLHYTATSTYSPVFNTFASNAPALGERPGVCSQFVVEKDGTIHQLTRLYVRCRHTVGLNHRAIGIEMVQQSLPGKHSSDRAILGRKAQIRSATKLAAWLKQRYRIRMRDVIGHAMANGSPKFKDLEGWKNDHVDWLGGDVRKFRKIVTNVIHKHR
jgi:N-acetylmuramoyl-L-alanine amidase